MADQTKAPTKGQDAEKAQERKRRPEPPVQEQAQGLGGEAVALGQMVGDSVMELPVERHAALLGDPRFAHPANAVQRARMVSELQRKYGNTYVQRMVNHIQMESNTYDVKRVGKHESVGILEHPLQTGQPSLQRTDGFFPIEHAVNLVPQPTAVSCWAAALAMVVGFRDSTSYPVTAIARRAGMNTTSGYGWSEIRSAVGVWGLSTTAPMSAYPAYWARLLQNHGPLWVVRTGAPYHAVVVGGIRGNGTLDGTQVTVYDPSPPNQGTVHTRAFRDFDRAFGLGAGADAQIVRA